MKVLLIDTCGDVGSVALSQDDCILSSRVLSARAASAKLLIAVAEVFSETAVSMNGLDAVAVVSGPGSFTGVRVGMAAAKGLCEPLNLPLIAISRLQVLEEAVAPRSSFAILDAGRGEAYVRSPDGREALLRIDELGSKLTPGVLVVIAEARMMTLLEGLHPHLLEVQSSQALPIVLRILRSSVGDAALADGNYVRGEQDIYQRHGA